MSFIRIVAPAEADGELARAYGEVTAGRGAVGNILAVHSVHPSVMVAHLRLYAELMFGASELTRLEREAMAVVVSGVNNCHY